MAGGDGAVKVKGWGRTMIICARIETEPNYRTLTKMSVRSFVGETRAYHGGTMDIRGMRPS